MDKNIGNDVMDNVAEIKNVSFNYKLRHSNAYSLKQTVINSLKGISSDLEICALKDINFNIAHGEVLGVIGSNGAGKSTLVKLIAGILPPSKGHVQINGSIAPLIELGVGFNHELTCRENIELTGVLLGNRRKEMKNVTERIADWAGLTDYLDLPVRTFSTGMAAKLAFAIATFKRSELLIVDEALSVGDQAFQSKSLKRMEQLISEGEAAILISHDLSVISTRATRVLWLEQGRQVMFGNPEKVIDAYRNA